MQLPRLGKLPFPPDGRVDPPEVRQRRSESQPVQNLRHARPHVGGALRAPVARRDRVPQPPRDRVLVDRGRHVDVAPAVGCALHRRARVLDELAEELAEEAGQQGPSEVEALVSVVIAVVGVAAPQGDEEEAMGHVAEEVGLMLELLFVWVGEEF